MALNTRHEHHLDLHILFWTVLAIILIPAAALVVFTVFGKPVAQAPTPTAKNQMNNEIIETN